MTHWAKGGPYKKGFDGEIGVDFRGAIGVAEVVVRWEREGSDTQGV